MSVVFLVVVASGVEAGKPFPGQRPGLYTIFPGAAAGGLLSVAVRRLTTGDMGGGQRHRFGCAA